MSPNCGGVFEIVPCTSPPALTDKAWRPLTPRRYFSYCNSIPLWPTWLPWLYPSSGLAFKKSLEI